MQLVLGSVYAGCLDYYASILNHEEVIIDVYEHFQKQSYRNRCVIAGANGPLNLIVPIIRKSKTALKDVQIDHSQQWRKMHWKSLESAYRTSPYFEYYEHEFEPIYKKEIEFLLDFNIEIQDVVFRCLQLEHKIKYSSAYISESDDLVDLRKKIHPKKEVTSFLKIQNYPQVFDDRMPFLPNLSVLDVLFNEGPMALKMLRGW